MASRTESSHLTSSERFFRPAPVGRLNLNFSTRWSLEGPAALGVRRGLRLGGGVGETEDNGLMRAVDEETVVSVVGAGVGGRSRQVRPSRKV